SYTAARLAAGVISFEEVGPELSVDSVIQFNKLEPKLEENAVIGNIDILDIRFGNLWTNIDRELFIQLDVKHGDSFEVTIQNDTRHIYKNIMTYGRSFADTQLGEPLLFVNSLDKLGVAINQGSFAKAYHIETGSKWRICIRK